MPNLTIRIDDEELLRRVKVLAAKRGTSVSALVRDYILNLVKKDDEYERARRSAVRCMRRGIRLGGRPLSRDEVYDDRVG